MTADTATASRSTPVAQSPDSRRPFLAYLEGARGFFGLLIMILHCWYRLHTLRPQAFPVHPNLAVLGHSFVGMFLVMSGLVLGLPVVKSGQTLKGGLRKFAIKRARRLLPAYYGALALSLPIAFYLAKLRGDANLHWLLESGIMHLFLVHNFSNALLETIDSPMWSIAVEVDVYVVFVLVLIPLARRIGFVPMVVAGFVLGLIPTAVGALQHRYEVYRLSESCFWYIGLFALGYAAANVMSDTSPKGVERRQRWPWQALAGVLTVVLLFAISMTPPNDYWHGGLWFVDMLAGLTIFSQFIADAQARERGKLTWFERFHSWLPLIFLGTFSYSFYLVCFPILDLFASFAKPDWSVPAVFAICVGGTVIALIIAYGFYCILERPFLSSYRRQGDAQSLQAAGSAADGTARPVAVRPATSE